MNPKGRIHPDKNRRDVCATRGFGNALTTKLDMNSTSAATKPTVTVTPGSSTLATGRPLPVTASVSGGKGNPEPTGTVTLNCGFYASEAAPLVSAIATPQASYGVFCSL